MTRTVTQLKLPSSKFRPGPSTATLPPPQPGARNQYREEISYLNFQLNPSREPGLKLTRIVVIWNHPTVLKWLEVKCDNFTGWHIYSKSPLSRYLQYKGHFYCPGFWQAFASRKLHTASVWRSRVSVSQVLYLWFTTTKRSYIVLCIHLERSQGGNKLYLSMNYEQEFPNQKWQIFEIIVINFAKERSG